MCFHQKVTTDTQLTPPLMLMRALQNLSSTSQATMWRLLLLSDWFQSHFAASSLLASFVAIVTIRLCLKQKQKQPQKSVIAKLWASSCSLCVPRSQPLPPLLLWPWEDFIRGIKAQPAYGHLAHTTRYLGAKIAFECKPKCRISSYGTTYCVNLLKPISLHHSWCRLDSKN